MATIVGTFNLSSTSAAAGVGVTFVSQETPGVVSSAVVIGQKVRKCLGSDGTLPAGTTLAEGRYTVQIDNGEEFDIDVPSGSGTSDISTLIVSEAASVVAYCQSGVGTPEGVKRGSPGYWYLDTSNGDVWQKITGTGTTGWAKRIGG
jgi:hypothetical protein